jgi:hypothetical protein
LQSGIQVLGRASPEFAEIPTPEAPAFVADLARELLPRIAGPFAEFVARGEAHLRVARVERQRTWHWKPRFISHMGPS